MSRVSILRHSITSGVLDGENNKWVGIEKHAINSACRCNQGIESVESDNSERFGWQLAMNHSDFYMGISLIEKKYRRKGLYNNMLDKVLSITKENGFSAVKSRHINTNNSVIIAKLKQGFIINGFEVDESMGSLLKLTYYHNEIRLKAAKFRAGNVSDTYVLNLLQNSIKR